MDGHANLIQLFFSRLSLLVLAGVMAACIDLHTEVVEDQEEESFDWNQTSLALGSFTGIKEFSAVTDKSVVVVWDDHPAASFYAVFYKF